jgi:hypothetical protein
MCCIVINTGCINIGYFLIKPPLTGANVLQPTGQLIKIIVSFAWIFQLFIVYL